MVLNLPTRFVGPISGEISGWIRQPLKDGLGQSCMSGDWGRFVGLLSVVIGLEFACSVCLRVVGDSNGLDPLASVFSVPWREVLRKSVHFAWMQETVRAQEVQTKIDVWYYHAWRLENTNSLAAGSMSTTKKVKITWSKRVRIQGSNLLVCAYHLSRKHLPNFLFWWQRPLSYWKLPATARFKSTTLLVRKHIMKYRR